MKAFYLILIFTCLVSGHLAAQNNPKVIGDAPYDAHREALKKELSQARTRYSKLGEDARHWRSTPISTTSDDIQDIENRIVKNQDLIAKINARTDLFALSDEIGRLEKALGIVSRSSYSASLRSTRELAQTMIERGRSRIAELNGEARKKEKARKQHNLAVNELEAKIARSTKKREQLDAQLEKFTSKVETQSIDDFLASTPNVKAKTDDFLSENEPRPNQSSNGDFLAESPESSSTGDFLASSSQDILNESNAFTIEYRGNSKGVVGANKEVLIPFKEWDILEYKLGLAKTSVKIKSQKFNSDDRNIYAVAHIVKVGFVDKTGQYVMEPVVTYSITGGHPMPSGLVFTDGTTSAEELHQQVLLDEKRKKEKKRQCTNDAKEWAIQNLPRYQSEN